MSATTFITQPALRPPLKSTSSSTSRVDPALAPSNLKIATSPPRPLSCPPAPLTASSPCVNATHFFGPPSVAAASNPVVVWFRADLRLHDHPALTHALRNYPRARILPVFIFDSRSFGKTQFGFQKTGRYRAKFLIDSVTALRDALRSRGSDLMVRVGHPEVILPALCRLTRAAALVCHSETSLDDARLESALRNTMHRHRVEFQALWANTLYHIDDLPFPLAQLPDAYAIYRQRVQTQSHIRDPLPTPTEMPDVPRVDLGDIPTLPQLGLSEPSPNAVGMHPHIGGEPEALRRLAAYVKDAATCRTGYASADHIGANFSCTISPSLALGCISPRQIYAKLAEATTHVKKSSTYFELVWRDFFRYIAVKYNQAKLNRPNTVPAVVTAS